MVARDPWHSPLVRILLVTVLSLGSGSTPSARAAPAAQGEAQCPGARASHLRTGLRGFVAFDPPAPSRVRGGPGRGAKIVGQLQPGDVFLVVGGPGCADNMTWWEVVSERDGLRGWSAEGDARDDWLLPCPGQAAGSDCQRASAATSPTMADLGLSIPALPAAGPIAYTTDDGALWLLDPLSGATERVVEPGEPVDGARWSPDGRWLAFTRRRRATQSYEHTLWLYDSQSRAAREVIIEFYYSFTWAPDSRSLIYDRPITVDLCGGGPSSAADGLWTVDVESGATSQWLAPASGFPLLGPAYAPDGQHLLFQEVRYCEGAGEAALWTAGTSGYRILGVLGGLDWSPDGQWIAYDGQGYGEPTPNLWLMRPDGRDPRALPGSGQYSNVMPRWSPDGARLLFVIGSGMSVDGLMTQTLGGDLATITTDLARGYGWSPDGQAIAFSTANGELRTVGPDGRGARTRAEGTFLDWGPAAAASSPTLSLAPLLQQKRDLIPSLESTSIVIGYEALRQPVTVYNEAAARTLIQDLTESDAVSPEQTAAFQRLLLQEQTLARTLQDYTVVSGYHADVAADVSGLFWGTAFLLATSKVSVARALESVLTKSLRDLLIWIASRTSDETARAYLTGGILAGLDAYEAQTDRGATAVQALSDTAVRQALAQRDLDLLVARVQPTLSQGVASVRGDGDPLWRVDGEATRAAFRLEQVAIDAHLQADTASIWHDGFADGRQANEGLKDLADLLSLSQVPFARVGSVWTRVQQLILDGVDGAFVLAPRLTCLVDLSGAVGVLAFDPGQTPPACTPAASQNGPRAVWAARPAALGPVRVEVQQDLDAYTAALDGVAQAIQSGSGAEVEAAVATLTAAQTAVDRTTTMALVLASSGDGDMRDAVARATLTLDAAAFDVWAQLAAYQESAAADDAAAGVAASARVAAAAGRALAGTLAAQTSAAAAGPAAVFADVPVAVDGAPGERRTFAVVVANPGQSDLAGAQLQVEHGGQSEPVVVVPAIAAGAQAEVTVSVEAPPAGRQTLTLTLDDGQHLDVARVLLTVADAAAEPRVVAGPTPTPASPAGSCWPSLGLAAALALVARRRPRSAPAKIR